MRAHFFFAREVKLCFRARFSFLNLGGLCKALVCITTTVAPSIFQAAVTLPGFSPAAAAARVR